MQQPHGPLGNARIITYAAWNARKRRPSAGAAAVPASFSAAHSGHSQSPSGTLFSCLARHLVCHALSQKSPSHSSSQLPSTHVGSQQTAQHSSSGAAASPRAAAVDSAADIYRSPSAFGLTALYKIPRKYRYNINTMQRSGTPKSTPSYCNTDATCDSDTRNDMRHTTETHLLILAFPGLHTPYSPHTPDGGRDTSHRTARISTAQAHTHHGDRSAPWSRALYILRAHGTADDSVCRSKLKSRLQSRIRHRLRARRRMNLQSLECTAGEPVRQDQQAHRRHIHL